jgi:hypothetical protein
MARRVKQMLQHPDGPVVGRQRLVRGGLSKVSWEALDASTAPLLLQQETRSPERAINTSEDPAELVGPWEGWTAPITATSR